MKDDNTKEKQDKKTVNKGKTGIIKYIIALIILGIIIIASIMLYQKIQNQKAADLISDANDEFTFSFVEFISESANSGTANTEYIKNQIAAKKYDDIPIQLPKALEALNNFEKELVKLYSMYDRILLYESDVNLPRLTFNNSIGRVKDEMEVSHNTFYECILHHNSIIKSYNIWAVKLIDNPDYDSYVETNRVKVLNTYYTSICFGFVDIDKDGKYEGKIENKE